MIAPADDTIPEKRHQIISVGRLQVDFEGNGDHANQFVVSIRHPQRAIRRHDKAVGIVESSHTVYAIARAGNSRHSAHGADRSVRRDLAEGLVERVRHEQIPSLVEYEFRRTAETRRSHRAIDRTVRTGQTRVRCHRAVSSDFPNGVIVCVAYEKIATGIESKTDWPIELRIGADGIQAAQICGVPANVTTTPPEISRIT